MPGTEHLNQSAPLVKLEPVRIPNIDLAPLFGDNGTDRRKLVREIESACPMTAPWTRYSMVLFFALDGITPFHPCPALLALGIPTNMARWAG